jgi:hypothetical protein
MIKLMSNGVEVRRGDYSMLEEFLELSYRGRCQVWAWYDSSWKLVEEV